MSLRFRRSVRLFPGVRLNFSRSGISTTVGVRGASLTLGAHGGYANLGLPGTGLSYRTKITPGAASGARVPAAQAGEGADPAPVSPPADVATALASGAVEISSAEVSALTSPGLGELKRLINEAAVRRRELTDQATVHRRELDRATRRLRFAQAFIVRIFTQSQVPQLVEQRRIADDRLEQTTAELEGCYIEVDFGFDDATLGTYAALVRSFDSLRSCQAIWDITSVAATNRVVERTVATQSLARTTVRFDFVVPQIVKSAHQAMRLENASGRDIYLYPAFLLMQDRTSDFALVEYGELQAEFSQSRFIEEGSVPSDAEVVGQTWKKANKDGSPDRRFKDNYAIPIARYAELLLGSPTGLLEAYQFSDFGKARAFAEALANHKRALTALAAAGGVAAPSPHAEAADDDAAEPEAAAAPAAAAPKSLLLDWMALAGLVGALALAGAFGVTHRAALSQRFSAAPHAVPAAAAQPTVSEPAPVANPVHKPRRKHHHKPSAATGAAQPPPTDAAAAGAEGSQP